jgi:hypothetical protein
VRFLISDTDPSLPLLSDEDIDYMLGKWKPIFDSVIAVAAVAAEQISRKFAGVTSVSADGVSVPVDKISGQYADMAIQLRRTYAREQSTGVIDLTNLMNDTTLDLGIKPLTFSVGMHDNPEAGQQAYGGEAPYPEIEGQP